MRALRIGEVFFLEEASKSRSAAVVISHLKGEFWAFSGFVV